ncbi:MAG: hypothetical protein FWC58_06980 [Desulfobulbus sp.]|nr:hypothetical protein [Desulfobulbus sp.]
MSEAVFPGDALAAAGLNRQHLFALADLPDALRTRLQPQPDERCLILLGHAGRRLWDGVQAAGSGGPHPIDDYCRQTIARLFAEHLPGQRYRLLYPGAAAVDLQALGKLAGWHHASPFMVGIDAEWGSWFAYRAVILCTADFPPTPVVERPNPCSDCRDRPCVAVCPAGAAGDSFNVDRCIDERLRPGSPCAHQCLARNACPVGREHRYDKAQMYHSYALSLATLQRWRGAVL